MLRVLANARVGAGRRSVRQSSSNPGHIGRTHVAGEGAFAVVGGRGKSGVSSPGAVGCRLLHTCRAYTRLCQHGPSRQGSLSWIELLLLLHIDQIVNVLHHLCDSANEECDHIYCMNVICSVVSKLGMIKEIFFYLRPLNYVASFWLSRQWIAQVDSK